jgi:hypothetical protein
MTWRTRGRIFGVLLLLIAAGALTIAYLVS